jgi:type VI secretion system protein ImpK
LAPEICIGQINVSKNDNLSKVTISSYRLFRSSRTDVNSTVIPLKHRLGESMNQLSGTILITGHSDSDPIRTERFPSSWHHSQNQAEAVPRILSGNLDELGRITVEGRVDLEPRATNATHESKARNRRVEIMLFR